MLVFDPPEVLEFTWGADRLRIELQADGAGTLLTLTDAFDDLGRPRATGPAGPVPGAPGHRPRRRAAPAVGRYLARVHQRYVTHLGPDASTIGPPPGWDWGTAEESPR